MSQFRSLSETASQRLKRRWDEARRVAGEYMGEKPEACSNDTWQDAMDQAVDAFYRLICAREWTRV